MVEPLHMKHEVVVTSWAELAQRVRRASKRQCELSTLAQLRATSPRHIKLFPGCSPKDVRRRPAIDALWPSAALIMASSSPSRFLFKAQTYVSAMV